MDISHTHKQQGKKHKAGHQIKLFLYTAYNLGDELVHTNKANLFILDVYGHKLSGQDNRRSQYFHLMDPGEQTQVLRLGNKHL